MKADINFSGTITVQDIFDFNNLWFAGPSVVETPSLTIDIEDVNGDGINDYVVSSPYGLFTPGQGLVKVLGGGNKGVICQFAAPAGENLFGVAAETVCDHDADDHREIAIASIIDPAAEHPVGVIHVYSLATCGEVTSAGFNADDYPMQDGGVFLASVVTELAELARFGTIGDDAIFAYADTACDAFVVGMPMGPDSTPPGPPPTTAPAWSPSVPAPTLPAPPGSWTPAGTPVVPATFPPVQAWECRSVPIGGGGLSCICSRGQKWGRWETYPAVTICGYVIIPPKIRWHVAVEKETCTAIVFPPAARCPNPPAGGGGCPSTYTP